MFAGVFTALIVWLIHGCMVRWARTRLTEDDVEWFLERGRLKIKAMIGAAESRDR